MKHSTISSTLPSIPDHSIIEVLSQGSRTIVCRALQEIEQQQVIIKLLCSEYPSFAELLQFQNQYQITKKLNISGVSHPISLTPWRNGYALILQDSGGIELGKYACENVLTWPDVLSIALQIASILHDLILKRIIHKDIKPANILIHPETKDIKLIDFSIASLLPQEKQELQNPGELEGTLAYLAPEQSGRMNRGIDYRVDFYALGVTLYELLCGELPFSSKDPIELIHCHIAKLPQPPHKINSQVPAQVSSIILKLMAKNAEDRYQSALGLKHDLQNCLQQWEKTGKVEALS
jgi:serine/threonine protein kinase